MLPRAVVAQTLVKVVDVGKSPYSVTIADALAYVVNRGSRSVSKVSLTDGVANNSFINAGLVDPLDIVLCDEKLFLADWTGSVGAVRIFDPTTGAKIHRLAVR